MGNLIAAILTTAALGGAPAAAPADAIHSCPLRTPRAALQAEMPGCGTVFADTASEKDPIGLWGQIACASVDRQGRPRHGGDDAPRAEGSEQGDDAYRVMRALDGDDFYGERCELGQNDSRVGPTALFHEGMRRATFASVRLPESFPLDVDTWQNVLQMKQTQPSDNGGGTPVLSLKAYDGRWWLYHSDAGATDVDTPLWSTPAGKDVWTRFAFDVTYSSDPDRGEIKLYVDLDGDGDFDGAGEESPIFITNTLKRETGGTISDGYLPGDSLPSHLRAGIYHDPEVDCPAPRGCAAEIDNVEVLKP